MVIYSPNHDHYIRKDIAHSGLEKFLFYNLTSSFGEYFIDTVSDIVCRQAICNAVRVGRGPSQN